MFLINVNSLLGFISEAEEHFDILNSSKIDKNQFFMPFT